MAPREPTELAPVSVILDKSESTSEPRELTSKDEETMCAHPQHRHIYRTNTSLAVAVRKPTNIKR